MFVNIKNASKIFYTVLGTLLLFKPPADPDFGWHYKYGQYLFNHGAILKENIFSYTFTDYYWANSYWLAQAIMYLPSHFLGDTYGPLVMSLVFSIALSFFIVKLFTTEPLAQNLSKLGKTVAIIVLFLFLSQYFVTVRPLYFSSIFMLLLTYILLFKNTAIKYLPIVFLLWANMHADFTLGGFIFAAFVLFSALASYKTSKKINVTYFPTLALSGLATFINPYGIYLHLTLLKETHPFQFQYITEWMPLTTEPVGFVFLVGIVALILISSWELKGKLGYWYSFVTILFLLLGVRSVYFFRVGIVIGIFAMAFYLDFILLKLFNMFDDLQKKQILKSVYIVGFFIFLAGLGLFANNIYDASSIERWSKKYDYPYEAVQYLKANPVEGNMFNEYAWGGYLIWHLPEKKTFIDGRMPSWRVGDESVFEEYVSFRESSMNTQNLDFMKSHYNITFFLQRNKGIASNYIEGTHKIRDDIYIFER